jgi:hypothetical protein
MKNILCKIIEAGRFFSEIIMPKGKDQKCFFGILCLVYAIFSLLMFYRTNFEFPDDLMDYDVHGWSHIYGQKNSFFLIFRFYRHPLNVLILYPLVFVNCIIQLFASGEFAYHMLFSRFFFNLIAATSVIVVYKYCLNLLKLNKYRALLICLLFALFAHVLLLSFNPETFPLSMLGLLVLIYMTTDNILNHKEIPLSANIILFCFITGVTISNGLKVLWAQLFQSGKLKKKIKTFLLSGTICSGLIIFTFVVSYLFGAILYGNGLLKDDTADFFVPVTSFPLMNVLHDFFCEPILFHHNYDFWDWVWTGTLQYKTIFPMIVNSILYTLVMVGLIINIKQKPVQLLLTFFLSDVLVHFGLGYGIFGSYIFSLHWVFIIPLLIGWLYYKIKSKQLKIGLDVLIICLTVFCAVNNFTRLYDLLFPTMV